MNNNSEKLNVFLANLAVLNIKVHNLHWNIVGPHFITIHKMTEKIYKMLQKQYDEVAETMKMMNIFPSASMEQYLSDTDISEAEARDYSATEVLEELDADCQTIMDIAKDIYKDADKNDNYLLTTLFEHYLAIYAHKSWMIRAMMQDDVDFDDEDDNSDETEE